MPSLNDVMAILQRMWVLVGQSHVHVGDFKWSAHATDHDAWMVCDGRSLQRAECPALFDILGTSFGSVDSDSFNIPDMRGRVMGSVGQGGSLTARALGASVGAETHTLQTPEIPSHTHTGTTDSAGAHSHTTNAPGGQGNLGLAIADGTNTATEADSTQGELNLYTTPRALVINSAGAHTHTFTTNATGGGSAHNNMQPTLFSGNVFIYAGSVLPRLTIV